METTNTDQSLLADNKTALKASNRLLGYISNFAERLHRLVVWRGAFYLLCAFAVASLFAAYLAIESGFDDQYFWLGRFFILIVLAIFGLLALWLPLQNLQGIVAQYLEQRAPEFAGRINTFVDAANQNNGMLDLLAEDAVRVASRNPEETLFKSREFRIPQWGSVTVVAFLVLMLAAGPGMMNHSLRYLYAGWAFNELLPPQIINVTPGDVLVKHGGNIQVVAAPEGFKTDELTLHVKMADRDWQQVDMSRIPAVSDAGGEQYDFRFFSIREQIQYYVTAEELRTPTYQIEVVDLPGVNSIQMTYDYPEWTGLEDEVFTQAADIQALSGTRVTLEVFTDSELPAGELVLNGESQPLVIDGERAEATFSVDSDGDYFLAATIGGEQVRMTDDFFIRLLEDQKPEIEFAFPGKDYNASNIEEVLTEVSVVDDFGIEKVELLYAVNGGEWQSLDLIDESFSFSRDTEQTLDHLFYLEDMTNEQEVFDQFTEGRATETVPLQPGDLIAYYAQIEDRSQTEQTDIFFIEVQPFDRRFSQADQGGGMSGGQGESELEISQRQREIIVSTWNLIREKNSPSTAAEENSTAVEEKAQRISDNTRLLAQLQRSLAEQAESLIETVRSRRMTSDDRVETYVRHIDNAIDAMYPASEELSDLNLDAAIGPEQTALQHLLRADAVFNDMQISFNQGGQGGGQASRDLAEMFELEMDMDRNQYETGSRASLDSQTQETDDALRDLEDLARRQQQLANNMRNRSQMTEAERYQQEMLRRETEELQQRLERLQQQQGQQSGQQTQQQGQQGQESSEGQGSSSQQAASELNRRLESAMDAMDRATEAMRSGNMDELQQAAGEAQRQLQGAGNQITEDQRAGQEQAFEQMARDAEALYRDQQRMEQRLLDGVDEAIANADPVTEMVRNPFSREEEMAMAEEKREMIERVQRLKEDMQNNATRVRSEEPGVARTLEQADQELKESEVAIRMDLAATYMRRGESLYIANSESMVTNALRSLRDSTEEALQMLTAGEGEQSSLDRLLSDIREGRSDLQDLANEAQSSGQGGQQAQQLEQGQSGQEPQGDQQGQNGQGQQGQDGQGGTAGGGAAGGAWNGWTGTGGMTPEIGDALTQQLNQMLNGTGNLVPELRARGVPEQQIRDIQNLVRELQNMGLRGVQDPSLTELNDTLALLEQLEAQVEAGLSGDDQRIRTEAPEIIPPDVREAVADYYRRLSDDRYREPDDGRNEQIK